MYLSFKYHHTAPVRIHAQSVTQAYKDTIHIIKKLKKKKWERGMQRKKKKVTQPDNVLMNVYKKCEVNRG